jgi:TldD protein
LTDSCRDPFLAWQQPLEDGVEALAQRCPDPSVFFEYWSQRRVEFGLRGVEKFVDSSGTGIALESGGESSRSVHLSDPDKNAVGQGVRSLMRGEPLQLSGKGPVPDLFDGLSANAEVEIRRILSRAPLGVGGARVGVRGKWLEYRQDIRIAMAGQPQRADCRQGRRIRLTISLARAGRTGTGTVDWVWRPGRNLDAAALVSSALERAELRLQAVPAVKGETVVVFAPGVGGVLVHEMFGHPLESDGPGSGGNRASALVRGGRGPDCREIRIIDDPRRGRVPWKFDDEGTPARAVALVDDGQLVGELNCRRATRTTGQVATGHGRRSSYLVSVAPRMGCTFVAAGENDPDQVLAETGSGVYIRRMAAATTDVAAGHAIFHVTDADRIEGGRVDSPLEPFLLWITLSNTLASLDRPCNDTSFDNCVGTCLKGHQPLAVSVGTPTIRLGLATVL